jgi:stage II sporulation protein D
LLNKSGYLLIFIFVILVIIPLFLVKEKEESEFLIKVYNHKTDQVVIMELDDYVRGVVAAEMPACYDIEALKAQAVAVRTYTIKQIRSGKAEYRGASLSTNWRECQAYLSEEEMKEKWGFLPFFYYWARINRVVEETRGEILLYQEAPIDAVYHANSGGITEDASYVWGNQTPYLKSVKSPHDQEQDNNFKKTYYFGLNELKEKLKLKQEIGTGDCKISRKNESGRVVELEIGNKSFSGIEFRQKLDLPSTRFEVTGLEGGILTLTVYGKGHGVGMSQDGANGMARHDYDYHEILKHYYQGVTFDYCLP